jgi:hypothetical protein
MQRNDDIKDAGFVCCWIFPLHVIHKLDHHRGIKATGFVHNSRPAVYIADFAIITHWIL